MQRFSIGIRSVQRAMLPVAVLVVGIAGSAVNHLNGIAGSREAASPPPDAANDIVPVRPRRVVPG